jgi:hypothetical protein
MNKELQTKISPINSVRALLERSKAQIAMALPKHLNADRIIRVAMTSIQRNPQLLECDPISLVAAVIQSSQLGLEPDGILGHAYLIPFNNAKKNRMEVQFIPGYKGLIDLARRSGQVVAIGAHVVYENEPFKLVYGYEETLITNRSHRRKEAPEKASMQRPDLKTALCISNGCGLKKLKTLRTRARPATLDRGKLTRMKCGERLPSEDWLSICLFPSNSPRLQQQMNLLMLE